MDLDQNTKNKIESRCNAIVLAFDAFNMQIEPYIACYWEFQTSQVTPIGLRISPVVLTATVISYLRDLERYKCETGFKPDALANSIKIGAFLTYWLAAKCPIYDTHQTPYAHVVNEDFALFAGMTLAEIDPHQARMICDSRVYKQLQHVLASSNGTPDMLVPIFEMLQTLAPHKKKVAATSV
jgi:hypothetical protein